MSKKQIYPERLYILIHKENDGDVWFEARESLEELDLLQGSKIRIASYGIEEVMDATLKVVIGK